VTIFIFVNTQIVTDYLISVMFYSDFKNERHRIEASDFAQAG
jgi:hypothetical protein